MCKGYSNYCELSGETLNIGNTRFKELFASLVIVIFTFRYVSRETGLLSLTYGMHFHLLTSCKPVPTSQSYNTPCHHLSCPPSNRRCSATTGAFLDAQHSFSTSLKTPFFLPFFDKADILFATVTAPPHPHHRQTYASHM